MLRQHLSCASPPASSTRTRILATVPGLAWAAFGYLLITLLLAFPVVFDIAGVLPSDLGDPALNVWILWHNATTLPFTEAWWSPPVFHPSPDVLSYSEQLFGLSLLSTPVYWVTGSPIVAYNVAFLMTFPLSGVAAYLLVFELTGRRDASWLGGLAFAFAPYRMEHVAHVQVLASYWMPLGLFALHRYYHDGRRRWMLLFGGATLMNGLTNGYYLLFYPVLVMFWVLWFTPNEAWWRKAGAIAASGALAGVLLAPTLLTYQRAHDAIGLGRSPVEMRAFSADAAGLLSGPAQSALWSFPEGVRRQEGQLFPGATAAALVGFALWRTRRRPREPEPRALRMARTAVGVIGLGFAAALLVRVLIGPWQLRVLGLPISTFEVDRIVAQGMLVWFCWALLSPIGSGAYRRHSAFAFYVVATLLLFILALGPAPTLFDRDFMAYSMYGALSWLPGYDGLRVPARFWMLGTICVASLVGLAFVRLVPLTHRYRLPLLVVVTLGILADGWINMPTVAVPAPSGVLGLIDAGVLELPLGTIEHDATSLLRATRHRQPLMNGYSGYEPPHYAALRNGLRHRPHETLDIVAGLGIRYVRIDRALDPGGALERAVSQHAGTRLVAEGPGEALYRLPPGAPIGPGDAYGQALGIATVQTNVKPHLSDRMLDGSLQSRWEGGVQAPGQEIYIDLARQRSIGAVVMRLGPYTRDFPRGLAIDVSSDGNQWTEVWSGSTQILALKDALRRPGDPTIVCEIGDHMGRYIRLHSTMSDPVAYWSIAELSVLAPHPK